MFNHKIIEKKIMCVQYYFVFMNKWNRKKNWASTFYIWQVIFTVHTLYQYCHLPKSCNCNSSFTVNRNQFHARSRDTGWSRGRASLTSSASLCDLCFRPIRSCLSVDKRGDRALEKCKATNRERREMARGWTMKQ